MDIREYILSKFPEKQPNNNNRIHTHCPFHDDKHASFSINVEKGLFICGSPACGLKGNFFLLFKLLENIETWKEVYERLRDVRPHDDVGDLFSKIEGSSRETKWQIDEFPVEPFVEPIQHIDYLERRYIRKEICDYFGIMYGKGGKFCGVNIGNSLVAPVYDIDGTYWTFQVRHLSGELRWQGPEGNSIQNLLYAGWLVCDNFKELWIVEGASDVWRLATYGIQSVGVFTKEASASQLIRIYRLCNNFRLTPVVCLDGDAYPVDGVGKDYNRALYDELVAYGLKPKIVYLRPDEDPGSLSLDRVRELICDLKGDNYGCQETNMSYGEGNQSVG